MVKPIDLTNPTAKFPSSDDRLKFSWIKISSKTPEYKFKSLSNRKELPATTLTSSGCSKTSLKSFLLALLNNLKSTGVKCWVFLHEKYSRDLNKYFLRSFYTNQSSKIRRSSKCFLNKLIIRNFVSHSIQYPTSTPLPPPNFTFDKNNSQPSKPLFDWWKRRHKRNFPPCSPTAVMQYIWHERLEYHRYHH